MVTQRQVVFGGSVAALIGSLAVAAEVADNALSQTPSPASLIIFGAAGAIAFIALIVGVVSLIGIVRESRKVKPEQVAEWRDQLDYVRRGPLKKFANETSRLYDVYLDQKASGPHTWEKAARHEIWPIDGKQRITEWHGDGGVAWDFAQFVYSDPRAKAGNFDEAFRAPFKDALDKWGHLAEENDACRAVVDAKIAEHYEMAKMLAFFEIANAKRIGNPTSRVPKGGLWYLGPHWKSLEPNRL